MTVAANDVLREQLIRAVQRSPGVMRSSLYRIGRIYGSGTVQDREGEVVDALDALVRGGVVRQRAVPDGAGQSRVATEVAYFAVDGQPDDESEEEDDMARERTNTERALAYLRSHGPARPEDIAEALGIHRSTVSGALRGRDDVRIEYVDPANPRKGGVWMLVETTPRGGDEGCASRRGYTTCDCGAEAERAEDLAGKLVGILADHVDGAVDGGAVDTLRRLIAERDEARVRASDFEQQLDDLVVERREQRTVAERDEARAKREVDRVTAERDAAVAKVEEMREHARREVQRIGDVLDRVAEAVGLVGADGGDRIIAEVRHVVERSHRLRNELATARAVVGPVWIEWGYHHLYAQGSTVLGDITTNTGGDAEWTVLGVGDGRAKDIGFARRIVEAVVAAGRQS